MRADVVLALLPLAAALPSATNKRETPAPVIKPRGAKLIEGKYIVKMRSGVVKTAVSMAVSAIKGDADYTFSKPKFTGFVSSLTDLELKLLQDDPNVDFIEQDAIVSIKAAQTQPQAPWGLARISSAKPGNTSYVYDSSAGEGTCAYVVDTGIEVKHKDFEGRAKWLANFADKDNTDGQGHGTHVAGTIGSKTYGVAKKTQLFAVKVLDKNGQGTNSQVIAGMDFVVEDAPKQKCPKGVVVNMSLGGSSSAAVNAAAAEIIDAGHFLAVAAGNESEDAKNSSPASEKSVCTVGATTKADKLAEYSNFGAGVDVLAPGSDILSTWIGGKTNTISGTSMASPHVAGLAAYLLGLGTAPKDPEQLCAYMAKTALSGVIGSVPKSTVNLLINNGGSPKSNATAPVKTRPSRPSRPSLDSLLEGIGSILNE